MTEVGMIIDILQHPQRDGQMTTPVRRSARIHHRTHDLYERGELVTWLYTSTLIAKERQRIKQTISRCTSERSQP
ncbi:hypothetical protein RRG08_015679 [Elysia crispata]|uniref:Uncharacterized protein n=1 Tax=Elysia crispata TaxID=231223 RepID=A0AAE1CRI0_9GAST|nr:hypothetical protein RRG08_015679 [Elysia crispata]